MPHSASARLATDIGGTFTDIALSVGGQLYTEKEPTTHGNPQSAVIIGIRRVLKQANILPDQVGIFIHGTTLATNALIERNGATTALLTTAGHRDSLEIGYENRFEQYDLNIRKPRPLVPREWRLPIRERMNWQGEILLPLNEQDVLDCLPLFEREQIESIAIGYLHAYANGEHEARTAELIQKHRPDLSITLASEVCPEIREYDRLNTACANACIRPLISQYLKQLDAGLQTLGVHCPFLLMTSGGGLTSLDSACRFPIRLVESGPAGGAILAQRIARDLGGSISEKNCLSFDMGGTTAKLCLLNDGELSNARSFEVDRSYRFRKGSGLPIRIPVIDMIEIGAGGGSVAHIDGLHRVQVGPESAGSDPGPVAWNRGGKKITVSDADMLLGKIIPSTFAAGQIKLDLNAAEQSMLQQIGRPLELDGEQTAAAVCDIVDENMALAARAHAAETGCDLGTHTLIAFGGAAPLHATALATKLGIRRVIIPANAGVGSAVGFLLAPIAYEVARSLPMLLSRYSQFAVNDLITSMTQEATEIIQPAADSLTMKETPKKNLVAWVRYHGQGQEIQISFQQTEAPTQERLREIFEDEYRLLYGQHFAHLDIEILSWALQLSIDTTTAEALTAAAPLEPTANAIDQTNRTHPVFFKDRGKKQAIPVINRRDLKINESLAGPLLITEPQTTTVIPEEFNLTLLPQQHLLLERVSKP